MGDLEKINDNFYNSDILSLSQFDQKSLKHLFAETNWLKNESEKNLLKTLTGQVIALLFSEPSTRTFGSFSVAIKRLGGQTLELTDPKVTSFAKGETLTDTIKVLSAYSDAIIIRHPDIGSALDAAEHSDVPVINAGDGGGEHPTQALLDLYTISEKSGKLDGITGVIAGDLANGRTVHSLLKGLALFANNTIYLLSPAELCLNEKEVTVLTKQGLRVKRISSENEIPENADFWYWTRVQKERLKDPDSYEELKKSFVLNKKLLSEKGNEKLILMHPLPRVGEIDPEVDSDKRAVYLTDQIRNGLFVRMALLKLVKTKK